MKTGTLQGFLHYFLSKLNPICTNGCCSGSEFKIRIRFQQLSEYGSGSETLPVTGRHRQQQRPLSTAVPLAARAVASLLVLLQRTSLLKGFVAPRTSERALARVNSFVNTEVVATTETFATFAAGKILGCGFVDFLMALQEGEANKKFGTSGTAELLL